jgi:hypothetical protein
MSIKKLLITFAISSVLSTSAFASADSAIAAAEAAQKAAAKVGYEWRDTGKMIKQAKKLAKEGKTADAIKLAKRAEEQGHDAVAQYKSETMRFAKMH